MNSGTFFSLNLGPVVVAQSSRPLTLAGRQAKAAPESNPLVAPSILGALCVLALALVVARAWRRGRHVPGRRAFLAVAGPLGLSGPERRLIASIGTPEPAAVLVSEHAFGAAVERWLESNPSESNRRTLASLAARLGWRVPSTPVHTEVLGPPTAPGAQPMPKKSLRLVA